MFRTAFDVPHYAWRRVVEMYRLARKSMPRVDAKYLVVSMLQAGCGSQQVDAQRAARCRGGVVSVVRCVRHGVRLDAIGRCAPCHVQTSGLRRAVTQHSHVTVIHRASRPVPYDWSADPELRPDECVPQGVPRPDTRGWDVA
jgi:hypothetical protein